MNAPSPLRFVQIAALDRTLVRALAEQRPAGQGWRFEMLSGSPDPDALVIVDFEESGERARQLAFLREAGFGGPVVILTSPDDPSDDPPSEKTPSDSAPLDGALDEERVGRPVRLGILLARIDAHGAPAGQSRTYDIGPYRFATTERVLSHRASGEMVRLTELERRLLVALAAARGDIMGRDQLLAEVWGYSEAATTHTVETHVWRLRQKIETDDPATRILLTDEGGYRLDRVGSMADMEVAAGTIRT